jgi:pyroglutamyl-peptidase
MRKRQARTNILVTGFGPFPGTRRNPSEGLVRAIGAGALRLPSGVNVSTAILPTSWEKVTQTAPALLARHQPDIALHFGLAREARSLRIEKLARNRTENRLDVDGRLPRAARVRACGPRQLHSALPANRIMLRLRALGLAVHLSHDAGGYLCNQLFYLSLLHANMAGRPARALFVHIPPLSEPVRQEGLVRAAEAIVGACAEYALENRRATGLA